MQKKTANTAKERVLCVLKGPKEEGLPFSVSVYAVSADRPRRILRAESSRQEVISFLRLMQEGDCAPERMAHALISESC